MRTTLTLDADVAHMLEQEAHRQRKPFKQVVNEAIRRGLAQPARGPTAKRYRVEPHRTTVKPGFDPSAFNKLADELEEESVLARAVAP